MIPAPANVLGRLSTILMDYEDLVAGNPRDNTHRGIAEFLKLYYDGRDAIPPDESNGNNPVSRYKVASDAWRQLDQVHRRTGDPRYAETRDLVAKLLPTGKPANTRDLAAQTIGLCLVDRDRFKAEIDANVKRLLDLQRPDGNWSVKFDPSYPIAEMQTGESLYALSMAALAEHHPAIRKGVSALLRRQKEFGGWFDTGPYEQFRTPFRETQWALIALSRIYPNPVVNRADRPSNPAAPAPLGVMSPSLIELFGASNPGSPGGSPARVPGPPRPPTASGRGWDDPLGKPPTRLRDESPSRLLRDLERIWDRPEPYLLAEVTGQLMSDLPMVRYAAALALSRVGGGPAIEPLAARLGDESKLVQRAAAEAIRSIGSRLNAARKPLETGDQARVDLALALALKSPDDRARRGASRVFAAHFRDLSQEMGLAGMLIDRLDDPDPVVQVQAIKGLWRWWYWRDQTPFRSAVEDALIARLAAPAHPWVRRNLIEALYIIGDENIRYLYNNWVPSLASGEARDRATAAQHATVNRLGDKYAAALDRGDPLQRDGVLRAISEFHERPAVQSGRVGNDTEPMLFYDDALPRVSSALSRRMEDPDPTIRRLALQALISLRGHRDPALSRAVAARQGDADASVREWAAAMAKVFPLAVTPGVAGPDLLALVGELLESPLAESQAAALEIVGRIGPSEAADLSAAIRARLKASSAGVRAAALDALGSFPKLLGDPSVRAAVGDAMTDPDPGVRVSAVRLALDPRAKVPDASLRKALDDPAPEPRIALLAAVAASKAYANDLRLVGLVGNSLVDENGGVREKALQAIQAHPSLVANPAVEEALRELTRSDNGRQKEIAKALLKSRGRSSAGGADADLLDLAYFEAKVLPVFIADGDDGQNCMGCHRSHTILRMIPPGADGRWSPRSVRENFRAALRVVNLPNPSESLLLGKPTWEAADEAEAQTDPTKKAHAGGVRFEKDSPEYQALLDWINGARLK